MRNQETTPMMLTLVFGTECAINMNCAIRDMDEMALPPCQNGNL